MPVFELVTEISARREICFDLARSIDLHKQSMTDSNEQAIAGITSGLIGQDEEVTWQATHFGIRQKLSSRITMFQFPCHFRDEMTRGVFRMIRHDHYFEEQADITVMRDRFEFESPFGVLGQLIDKLILTGYLEKLILTRNQIIKEYAESHKWKLILKKNEK